MEIQVLVTVEVDPAGMDGTVPSQHDVLLLVEDAVTKAGLRATSVTGSCEWCGSGARVKPAGFSTNGQGMCVIHIRQVAAMPPHPHGHDAHCLACD